MGPDASHIVSSVAKSLDVDRSPNATQRASEVSQEMLAGESTAALTRKKTEAAVQLSKEKIRREHEKRRRDMERRGARPRSQDEEEGDSGLDVVV